VLRALDSWKYPTPLPSPMIFDDEQMLKIISIYWLLLPV
jgi:hypothetical protein